MKKFFQEDNMPQSISNMSNMMKVSDIPQENNITISKVRKNSEGDITDVMLSNGEAYPIEKAVEMTKEGLINGVNVSKAKNGREYLKSNPNGTEEDNLSNKPTF